MVRNALYHGFQWTSMSLMELEMVLPSSSIILKPMYSSASKGLPIDFPSQSIPTCSRSKASPKGIPGMVVRLAAGNFWEPLPRFCSSLD
eukprot:1383695-Amorphochlora_amoeboformis.AAC.1